MMKRKIIALVLCLSLCLICTACVGADITDETSAVETNTTAETTTSESIESAKMFTDRDKDASYADGVNIKLSDNNTTSDGNGVRIDSDIITINKDGTYVISGTLTNGQIIVNVSDTEKVQLVLNSADISCVGGAAIYVVSADKVFITEAENTDNKITSKGDFVQTDDNNVDAAIFSKSDLTMNGGGSLSVNCENGHGVVSKDDLAITGGVYNVNASGHGFSGKDSVRIAGGSFTLVSGTDGISSSNTEDTTKGFVYIEGGTFEVVSGGDSIYASGMLTVSGGIFTLEAGGGNAKGASKQEVQPGKMWGAGSTQSESGEDNATSCKGLKSDSGIAVNGGMFTVDSADDSVHTNGSLIINGGTFDIMSGDDGMHADSELDISGGSIDISKSYEGIEGAAITISGGTVKVTASDDGLNAAGGNDGSSVNSRPGQNPFDVDTSASITISGGNLSVNASGDGIDSNGSLLVSGGIIYVNGPTSAGNGALDFGGSGTITGGTLIAVGAVGMDQNFDSDSTQGTILVRCSSIQKAGALLTLKDSSGNIIAEYAPEKEYQSVVISVPGVSSGNTYTLISGAESTTVEMTSTVYGSSFVMGGKRG